MTKRGHINLTTKLAAALLTMKRPDENGVLVPFISHEHAKLMSDEQIISLFNFDHCVVPKAHDGPDEAWNLEPLPIMEHRVKTATKDIPQIAKTKRLSAAHAEFCASALSVVKQPKPAKRSSFPQGRKLQSRNTFKDRRERA